MKDGEMEDNLRLKLGIKPGNKVCLFHARKDLMPLFMKGDLNLMIDWAEDECDAVLYWLQPGDGLKDIMTHLERQIKPRGRIWLVLQNKAAQLEIERIQEEVSGYTNLLKGKVVNIGEGESALQFVIRKDTKE
jgi:hypothetical protein